MGKEGGESADESDEGGGNNDGGKQVGYRQIADFEQFEADSGNDEAAGCRHLDNHIGVGVEDRFDGVGTQTQAALIDKDSANGGQDAPSQRSGEAQSREAIQRCFNGQFADVAVEAVEQRSQDGQRADTEDEARCDESFAEGIAPVRQALLHPVAHAREPVFDAEQFADEATDEQAAQED